MQKDGRQFVDFTKFHDTIPITEQPLAGTILELPYWHLKPLPSHFPALEKAVTASDSHVQLLMAACLCTML